MSNTGDREIGWASIKGRPSIHNHPFCIFAHGEAMGRVGLPKKQGSRKKAQRENQSNKDTDVVDHAFSNPSKSLPATSSLHSYCSDEITEDELPVREQHEDSSYQSSSGSLYNTSNDGRTPANGSEINTSDSNTKTCNSEMKQSGSKLLWVLGLVCVAATVSSMFKQNTTIEAVYDELTFYKDIDQLGNKYRISDNAVLQMQTGIATISKREDTGSFMFVYNSNNANFNEREFNMFISQVSDTASKYLRNESTPSIPLHDHHTLVEAAALDMYGHSELISKFRGDLDRTGVMLVKQVEEIPSSLAMAFHYYCDEYNPLVKKSAIFFTLNLAKCPLEMEKKSTHATIEKCLAQKWSDVPTDSIGPLLTRVVSVVIDLTDAF